MKTIELGYGYRLNRVNDLNWALERFRPADKVRAFGKDYRVTEGWKPTGRYYQNLNHAIRSVYELVLRDGDDAVDLAEALDRAEKIAATLGGVGNGN